MASIGITEKLARTSARRPWLVIGIWALVFVVGGILASGIGNVLTTEESMSVETESATGQRLIDERLRPEQAQEFVIVRSPDATIDHPEFRAFVEDLSWKLAALEGTTESTYDYYSTGNPALVSSDRHTSLLVVNLTGEPSEAETTVEPVLEIVDEANGHNGFEVLSAGTGSASKAFTETSEKDLQRGEMISLPIALIVLLVVFGAAVAAGVPLLVAIVSIAVAVGISALIGQFFGLSVFVVNMITMIGLAVGVDYSLFIIHRVRDERAAGADIQTAISRSGATASRAVLFSGGTVVVALAGLFIVPTSVYRSLAVGSITVATIAVIAALTLLPAILSLLGDKIDALRVPFIGRQSSSKSGGVWSRITSLVMGHPLIATTASAALLLIAAAPLLTIQLGLSGVSGLPEGTESRRAFEVLEKDFAGGMISPMQVVVDADISDPSVQSAIERLDQQLAADGAFSTPVVERNDAGDLAVVSVATAVDPDSPPAHAALSRIRNEYAPAAFGGVDAGLYVTGQTAESRDMLDLMTGYMPFVFAFVLGLSFILLLMVFRSIVVPIKAIIMNLLSVGAAYGLIVLVFQHGIGDEVLGFQKSETIESWLPLFLFAVLFGLSMDYHVFLLSRIKERFDLTGDNAAAVAHGMRSTSGLITGAALIMVTVFSGFAMGQLGPMQQMGFGLAVAVILDATIIRSILVPASMQLLGNRNWYLPDWMSWLPEISVEGPQEESPAGATA